MELVKLKSEFRRDSFDDYRANPAFNASGAKEILKSPLHYRQYMVGAGKQTPAMAFGTACHTMILEPELFSSRYTVAPECDRRTKEGKAIYAQFLAGAGDKKVIDAEIAQAAERVRENVMGHPVLKNLLTGGAAEVSGYFTELNYNVPCKMRPDYVRDDQVILDIKTAQDASPRGFQRAIANFSYHVQAAFYIDGLVNINGGNPDDVSFVFVVVENTAPYAVALYVADPEMIKVGRRKYREALGTYLECCTKNVWPGYSEQIQTIALPNWLSYE